MQPVNIEFEEDVDGIRFNWNRWPSSRVELEKIVLTLGCLYTPLKEPSDSRYNVELAQTPLICCRTTCKAILNPFCYPDLQSQHKGWICNFCNQRNQFPQQYQHITQPNQIPELCRNTIDYILPNQPPKHPLFVYVIDSSVSEEEFASLKSSIISSVRLLPPNAQVALITFNHIVYVWELHNEKGRSFVFDGDKDYKPKQIQDWLGLSPFNQGQPQQQQQPTASPANRPMPYTNGHSQAPPTMMNSSYPSQYQPPRAPNAMNQPYIQGSANYPAAPNVNQQSTIRQNKFIRQASQVESIFEAKLDGVSKNTWPTPIGRRPLRAVGAAISMAINILEITYQNSGGRIMLFLGGPCTVGPGMIVDDDLKNTIRTHHDIDKDNAKYMKKATEYYNHLASRAATNGHAIDIFSCALDQTGLSEMKCCTNMTNGLMVMCDSFCSNLFQMSFERIFSKDKKNNLKMAFNALLDVKTSRELKVSGAIGSCVSMNRKTQYVADKKDGISGTSQWKFCSLTPNSSTAFYYVVQNSPTISQAQQYPCGYVQFVTNYQGSDGYRHVRVTTTRRQFGTDDLEFDQESAVVLLARMACHKSDANEGSGQEILRWLDKSLVRVCQKFGDYTPNQPDSFRLKDPFCMFPIFLFNLRRSQFIQVFNNSPDETSFYRHSLMREDCLNSLLMIQPSLMAYDINGETKPVSLDTSSIQPDRILLMDTFFQIVIFHCDRIAAWKRQKYQDQPDYNWFKLFLEVPIRDANELMINRFPLPRYVVCDQGDSQSRFLLSKVNPSVTHNTAYGDANSAPVLSDDVSYGVFEDHLKKLTVNSAA